MGKHKKGQDRDKYYHLAKDQGYRARSAFKLIEINKRHDFLGRAKVVIDLCAAPGGWCQVAAKTMPKGGIILGVDLLPIRPIRNVKTIVSDITTEECRNAIKKELQTWRADVVLCDGAPNIGTSYSKDAFVQNEIALAALKVATQHLMKNGTFVTKVYRSQDYNSFVWVVQQFFQSYQAVKPASSRSQSAEIFIVGLGYKAPDSIDPRLLDPKHVFDQSFEEGMAKGISVFHKKYDLHNKRHRTGYDPALGPTLQKKGTVTAFVDAADPIATLSDMHVLEFTEGCAVYKQHKDTTPEVLLLCSDLRVLGKADFKGLLKWRLKMVAYRDELKKATGGDSDEEVIEDENSQVEVLLSEADEEAMIQDEIRDMRLKVLAENKRVRKKERHAASKLRQRVAMGMESASFSVDDDVGVFSLSNIESREDLETIANVNLSQVSSHDLGMMSESEDEGAPRTTHDSDDTSGSDSNSDSESDTPEDAYSARLEEDLDAAYEVYLSTTKSEQGKAATRIAKRTKKAKTAKAEAEEMEDTMMYDGDQGKYLEMLAGPSDSDDDGDDSDEEDDGYNDPIDDAPPVKRAKISKQKSKKLIGGGLLVEDESEEDIDGGAATARWFSSSLFKGVEDAFGKDAAEEIDQVDDDQSEEGDLSEGDVPENAEHDDVSENGSLEDEEAPENEDPEESDHEQTHENTGKNIKGEGGAPGKVSKREKKVLAKSKKAAKNLRGVNTATALSGVDADITGAAADILSIMPKTDKEARKAKRKRDADRKERKVAKLRRGLDEEPELDIVKGDDSLEHMDTKQRQRELKARKLIAAGMGKMYTSEADDNDDTFEIATATATAQRLRGNSSNPYPTHTGAMMPVPIDDRAYGSDDEIFDADDRAKQLALGTMMLRKHRAKEILDAAYNRYSWNDPKDLPSWFTDDEQKHYRPQVPIPPALIAQMKEKFISLAQKPINKVAEARARKRKRASTKLKAAKKTANVLASNPDMSERQKSKAVAAALRKGSNSAAQDKPVKAYVVAKKFMGGKPSASGAKGKGRVKFVDSRMKNDTRSMKRAAKKKAGKPMKKRRH